MLAIVLGILETPLIHLLDELVSDSGLSVFVSSSPASLCAPQTFSSLLVTVHVLQTLRERDDGPWSFACVCWPILLTSEITLQYVCLSSSSKMPHRWRASEIVAVTGSCVREMPWCLPCQQMSLFTAAAAIRVDGQPRSEQAQCHCYSCVQDLSHSDRTCPVYSSISYLTCDRSHEISLGLQYLPTRSH